MTIEEKLKDLILTRYKSMREFTQVADIPYTTMDSILKRGVANSSVSNIVKICKVLNLSMDDLANGEIVSRYEKRDPTPVTDVKDVVVDMKSKLYSAQQVTIDGRVIDIESVEPIFDALDIGVEMTRKKSMKKNVPETITETITES